MALTADAGTNIFCGLSVVSLARTKPVCPLPDSWPIFFHIGERLSSLSAGRDRVVLAAGISLAVLSEHLLAPHNLMDPDTNGRA